MLVAFPAALALGAAVPARAPAAGWATCGGLPSAYNATACPSSATCCHQNWAPGAGSWGCIDNDSWGPAPAAAAAVCCANNFTACPAGHSCSDQGGGAMVRTTCVPTPEAASRGAAAVAGRQVCKQGAPLPLSTQLPNVLVVGDSVSIGYTPLLAKYMAPKAFVQHSPWGGDGGAEEAAYGVQCLDYLLRAPDGRPLRPEVLMYNWGLHSRFPAGSTPVVPGQHGDPAVYAANLEKITQKLVVWAGNETKLLFAVTSPSKTVALSRFDCCRLANVASIVAVLNDKTIDDVVVKHNKQAVEIMNRHRVPMVDLHGPIIAQCGAVPQAECWGQKGCWSPHCPCGSSTNCCPCTPPSNCPCGAASGCPTGSCPCAAAQARNGSVCGYGWLANSTIIPALEALLPKRQPLESSLGVTFETVPDATLQRALFNPPYPRSPWSDDSINARCRAAVRPPPGARPHDWCTPSVVAAGLSAGCSADDVRTLCTQRASSFSWLGADCASSLRLPSRGRDATLWLFGDTLLGSMSNVTGLRNVRGCQMPHQSIGLQQGTGPIRYTVSVLSKLPGPFCADETPGSRLLVAVFGAVEGGSRGDGVHLRGGARAHALLRCAVQRPSAVLLGRARNRGRHG